MRQRRLAQKCSTGWKSRSSPSSKRMETGGLASQTQAWGTQMSCIIGFHREPCFAMEFNVASNLRMQATSDLFGFAAGDEPLVVRTEHRAEPYRN